MLPKGLSHEEQSAIRDFSRRLRDRFPGQVIQIRLYGSKARGTSHGESDVDLLVLVRERTSSFEEAVIDIICDVLNSSGVFLETVTLSTSQYEEAKQRQYPFVLNVERDAISL